MLYDKIRPIQNFNSYTSRDSSENMSDKSGSRRVLYGFIFAVFNNFFGGKGDDIL